MAAANTYAGETITLLAETNVANTYAALCAIDGKSLTLSKQTSSTVIPDCDNPADARWTRSRVQSFSATINGTGLAARENITRLRELFLRTTANKWRVVIPGTGANGGGTWEGWFHLNSLEIGTEYGDEATVQIALVSDGVVFWTAAA